MIRKKERKTQTNKGTNKQKKQNKKRKDGKKKETKKKDWKMAVKYEKGNSFRLFPKNVP